MVAWLPPFPLSLGKVLPGDFPVGLSGDLGFRLCLGLPLAWTEGEKYEAFSSLSIFGIDIRLFLGLVLGLGLELESKAIISDCLRRFICLLVRLVDSDFSSLV